VLLSYDAILCLIMQRQVHVFDRRGKLYYHITLPTPEFPHDERMSGTRALQVSQLVLSLLPWSFGLGIKLLLG